MKSAQTMYSRLSARRFTRGATLIELMVGLTIGLILIIIASVVYLYSKQSYNAVSENSQMEENGRFAIDLLTKYIQSAGFAMVDPTAPGPTLPLEDKLAGCAYGYANAAAPTTLSDLACRTATPTGARPSASISTRYETDAYASSAGKQQGFDCTNAAAASKLLSGGVQTYEVRSYFFVSQVVAQTPYGTKSMGQLSCVSDTTPIVNGVLGTVALQAQPLVPGIEQLAISYISAAGQVVPVPTTAAGWKDVAAIDLCVLARSIQSSGNDTGTGYTDCYGTAIAAVPTETYRTIRSTVALRNTASL
ncbi:PilW family protein [Variovorax sp. RT4R15]|uniref:PilW family protein n=1 Tax=Variovorax sp. RT4R15 TaxID=3443737 RepID=UPI003F487584